VTLPGAAGLNDEAAAAPVVEKFRFGCGRGARTVTPSSRVSPFVAEKCCATGETAAILS
jgi:hypothetical protein